MIRFLTAGESHGKALTTIVEGFPSNLKITKKFIDAQLKRRQMGYGRGGRMKIETDTVEILSGIRYGKTMGSPISLLIRNKDWENWTDLMDAEKKSKGSIKITVPRPGHADLTGISKYNLFDIRNSIERSSARETAARVAAGSVALRLLEEFGIHIGSFVESIGGIFPAQNFGDKIYENKIKKDFNAAELSVKADKSSLRVLDKSQEEKIINKIKFAKKTGNTLGGTFFVVATGVPIGLGSFMHYDKKLDADIASAMLSINAVKGVEIGQGFQNAMEFGSNAHDEIVMSGNGISRRSNRAGGLEGSISTGLPIVVRGAMKPIATLMRPIKSVDLTKMKNVDARRERSDFVAVPACAVIGETMLAWVIASHLILKFGGDSIEEMKDNFNTYNRKLYDRVRKNFKQ